LQHDAQTKRPYPKIITNLNDDNSVNMPSFEDFTEQSHSNNKVSKMSRSEAINTKMCKATKSRAAKTKKSQQTMGKPRKQA